MSLLRFRESSPKAEGKERLIDREYPRSHRDQKNTCSGTRPLSVVEEAERRKWPVVEGEQVIVLLWNVIVAYLRLLQLSWSGPGRSYKNRIWYEIVMTGHSGYYRDPPRVMASHPSVKADVLHSPNPESQEDGLFSLFRGKTYYSPDTHHS